MNAPHGSPSFLTCRVLLVDDSEDDRHAIARYLRRGIRSFAIREARGVSEGMARLSESPVDVLIVDQHMGGDSGTVMLESVRELDLDCAVVMITGSDGAIDLDRLFEAGADDYLRKEELSAPLLERVISNALAKAKLRVSLRRTTQRLEEQLAFEERLIGVVSHDLRTPLSSILMAATVLTDEVASEDGQGVLQVLERSGQRIRSMTSQLLDLTRIRRGAQFPLERQRADTVEIIHQVIDELSTAYPHARFVVETPKTLVAHFDPSAFAQLATNLLANALEHGADAPIGVQLRRDGDGLHLRVSNRGEPIDPASLATLFDAFARGRMDAPGLGLGLFIVRSIADAHGGTVEASSDADATHFSVRMPLARPER
ncbi:MAG: hybrid sensor histidine kinase/response regulator [Myxococcota bacterium]